MSQQSFLTSTQSKQRIVTLYPDLRFSDINDPLCTDNIAYYKCDVSKWEEVEEVAKKVIEEVQRLSNLLHLF
jgi:enoyl-[acyl-carrier-protein] reductase (NADH)